VSWFGHIDEHAAERRALVDRLREKRLALGLRQADVGVRIGVPHWDLSRWERHERAPCAVVAAAWAQALGVRVVGGSLEELFRPAVPPCGTPSGYRRHKLRRERCQPCWAAWSAHVVSLAKKKASVL
jgi:transcriptional regulator with XRE-family HTH domain